MATGRVKEEVDLILRINHVYRAYRKKLNRVLADHGLSDSQALPVRFIDQLGDGVRQGVLAEHLGVEGPSLVRQIDQLCAGGFVVRREDPADRRGRTLHLTPRGRQLATIVEEISRNLRRRMLASVSDRDLSAALRALTMLDSALAKVEDA